MKKQKVKHTSPSSTKTTRLVKLKELEDRIDEIYGVQEMDDDAFCDAILAWHAEFVSVFTELIERASVIEEEFKQEEWRFPAITRPDLAIYNDISVNGPATPKEVAERSGKWIQLLLAYGDNTWCPGSFPDTDTGLVDYIKKTLQEKSKEGCKDKMFVAYHDGTYGAVWLVT